MFIDSPISHDFSFTPAVSLFINLPNEEALEQAFHRLAEGGKVLMPLDDYGFSARFGWLNDRFGLSGSSMCRRGSALTLRGVCKMHGSSSCCSICLSPGQELCRGEYRPHHGRCELIDFDRYVEQAKSYGEWRGHRWARRPAALKD